MDLTWPAFVLPLRQGLNYGKSFQGIKVLYHNEAEVLSKISLPKDTGYILQPGILDCALQTSMGLNIKEKDSLSLPFGVKEVNIYGDVSQTAWCYCRKSANDGNQLNTYQIDLLSEEGFVLLSFKDFVSLPASGFPRLRRQGGGDRQQPR